MSLFTYSYRILKLLKKVYRQRLMMADFARCTSQVRVRLRFFCFFFFFCFVFIFIKGCDCDSSFHNNVPPDVQSIKHERDIIVNAITRIHCSAAN